MEDTVAMIQQFFDHQLARHKAQVDKLTRQNDKLRQKVTQLSNQIND
jgi:phage shock protein A